MAGDDWRPSATRDALRQRAGLYRHIRAFMAQRDVLEVSTPVLGRHGVTDPAIEGIDVPGHGVLQTSPEYHMKRLLAAGSGAIYQVAPVFRQGEYGARHNPEFTLLEWYRPGLTLAELVEETVALLQPLLHDAPVQHVHFRHIFAQVTGVDPLDASLEQLRAAIPAHQQVPELDRPQLVDWLMACVVEPALPADTLVAIDDFPPWAAALSRLHTDASGDTVAQRFELYFNGLELANGYQELVCAEEQQARFHEDNRRRQARGLPQRTIDERLLAAMRHGLPDCAGVAVGLERVLMACAGSTQISEVLAFPWPRA